MGKLGTVDENGGFLPYTDEDFAMTPPTAPDTGAIRQHDWVKSNLGHGESMCRNCLITNREAAVLGRLNKCDTLAKEGDTP